MRLTKLSLVAAMLIGSTAFAIENTKVSGDVKLFYGTMDNDNTASPYAPTNIAAQPTDAKTSLFDSKGSYGNAAVDLSLTTDLTKGVSAGVKGTFVTTLGLENNLVDNTWSNAHGVTANPNASFSGGYQLDDAMFIGELWVAGSAFDTTAKVGRQALDTPLAFTETWGIDQNTFEAAVLINQSIPDTTLVGAYVGKSNGSAGDLRTTIPQTINTLSAAQAGVVAQGGKFNTFGTDGVYVAGLVNNTIKPLTVQAWYYSLQQLATAYWLQADVNVEGIMAGLQYSETDLSDSNPLGAANAVTNDMFSVMLGYEMKDVVTVKAAYSSVGDITAAQNAVGFSNVDTGGQSKMYTEMWWAYGYVSDAGSDSYSLTAEATVAGIDLLAGYYSASINPNAGTDLDVTEIALVASKSFGPLDTSVAVIMDEFDDKITVTDSADTTHLQVYLTYNF